jgi:hypothetical protein
MSNPNPSPTPPIYGSRMFRAFPLTLPEEMRTKIRKVSKRRGVSQAQYIRDAVIVALSESHSTKTKRRLESDVSERQVDDPDCSTSV